MIGIVESSKKHEFLDNFEVDAFEYIRVCFFEKFPRNISLTSDYLEDDEIVAVLRDYLERILSEFEANDFFPVEGFAWRFFDELNEAGLLNKMEDPVAGVFYWTDLKKVGSYMSAQISDNEIYARKCLLKNDRFYQIVFDKILEGDFEFNDESNQSEGTSRGIPASDRIVDSKDNQEKADEAVAKLEELEKKIRSSNEGGAIFGDDREYVADEIGILRTLLLQTRIRVSVAVQFARSCLTWISEKAGSAVIGDLSKRALALILDWLS